MNSLVIGLTLLLVVGGAVLQAVVEVVKFLDMKQVRRSVLQHQRYEIIHWDDRKGAR